MKKQDKLFILNIVAFLVNFIIGIHNGFSHWGTIIGIIIPLTYCLADTLFTKE